MRILVWASFFCLTYGPAAFGNPTGERLVAGSALVDRNGHVLTIQQDSDRAIIDWQSFSIGKDETVAVRQASADAALLSRVSGGGASQIDGMLTANGKVFLINPYGITTGGRAFIQTAVFLGSTLDVRDGEFLAGRDMEFSGSSAAGILQRGTIVTTGGDVVLIARDVKNDGTITAAGQALLGSGQSILVREEEGIWIRVPCKGTLSNDGTIEAVSAMLKGAGIESAINLDGMIEAGEVLVEANTVEAAGTIWAESGNVKVLADAILLAPTAVFDVSGRDGGGRVDLLADGYINMPAGAEIWADAWESGNGGIVNVIAEDICEFEGFISAKGLGECGDGGFADVSGHGLLAMGGRVDLRSVGGKAGTLLLDPASITISSGASTGVCPIPTTATTIHDATIAFCLASGNVTLTSTGTISVSAGVSISWATNNTLTLNAATGITITSGTSITCSSTGGITFTNTGGTAAAYNGIAFTSSGTNNTTISTGGAISMTGTGGTSSASTACSGIVFSAGGSTGTTTVSTTGSGTLTLNGTAGATTASHGISIVYSHTTLSTVNGTLMLTGTVPSTAVTGANGFDFTAGTVTTSGTGAISITGTSSASVAGINGIAMLGGTVSTTGGGAVTMFGQAAVGIDGLVLSGTGSVQTSSGSAGTIMIEANPSMTISSTANPAVSSTTGQVVIETFAGTNPQAGITTITSIINSGSNTSPAINIMGNNNAGTAIAGVTVSTNANISVSGSGSLNITGTNSGSGAGFTLAGGTISTSSGSANINITGTNTGSAFGAKFLGGTVTSSIANTITVTGTGGSGAAAQVGWGVQISGGTISTTGTGASAGNLMITGTASGASPNAGIFINSGSAVSTADGTITMVGTGGTTGGSNYAGIYCRGTIQSTGVGSITLTGNSGVAGIAGYDGFIMPSGFTGLVQTNSGSITINTNNSISIGTLSNASQPTVTTATGSITIQQMAGGSLTSTAFNGITNLWGTISTTGATPGAISITLTTASGNANPAINVNGSTGSISAAGSGAINLTGTSNSTVATATGFTMSAGSITASSGAITVTATSSTSSTACKITGGTVTGGSGGITIAGSNTFATTAEVGFVLSGGTVSTTSGGPIMLTGNSGKAGADGFQMTGTGAISTDTGNITINTNTSFTFSSTASPAITATSTGGTISIAQLAGGGLTSAAFAGFSAFSSIVTTASNTATAISIAGQSATAAASVLISGSLSATGTGGITITGTGVSGIAGATGLGFSMTGGTISAGAGGISITGTSNNTTTAEIGYQQTAGTISCSGNGNLALVGNTGAAGADGFQLTGGSVSTASGTLTINSNTSFTFSSATSPSISTTSGMLTIQNVASGGLTFAGIGTFTTNLSTTSGPINITVANNTGAGNSLNMGANSSIQSATGSITIACTSNVATGMSMGTSAVIQVTGASGNIAISSTATTTPLAFNFSGALISNSAGTGSISITGSIHVAATIGTVTFSSGSGGLTLSTGTGGCTVFSATLALIVASGGNFMFTGDAFPGTGGATLNCGGGSATFVPATATTAINIEGGVLGIPVNSISNCSTLNIGNSSSNGTVTFTASPTWPSIANINIFGTTITTNTKAQALGADNMTWNVGPAAAGTATLNANVTTTGTFAINGQNVGSNTFNVASGASGTTNCTITGGSQNDSLQGTSAQTYNITGSNSGTLSGFPGINFVNCPLLGSAPPSINSFVFSSSGAITSATVLTGGGPGTKTIDMSAIGSAVAVALTTGANGSLTIGANTGSFTGINNLIGSTAMEGTLTGQDTSGTTITISGADSGTISALSWSQFNNLASPAINYTYAFSGSGTLSGNINAATTNNAAIDCTSYSTSVTFDGSSSSSNTGILTAASGVLKNSSGGNIVGGTITIKTIHFLGSTAAASPNNFYKGFNVAGRTYTVTGVNTLSCLLSGGVTVVLTNVQSVSSTGTGSSIVVDAGARVDGTIFAPNNDATLNTSAYTTAHTIVLTNSATPILTNNTSAVGAFNGFVTITGSSNATNLTTLQGPNAANTWSITGASAGTFTAGPTTLPTFTAVQNLQGGSGASDTFTMQAAGSLNQITGGSGTQTYDFRLGGTVTTVTGGSGGAASNTILGVTSSTNTFNITSGNAGTLAGVTSFTGVGNLTGGTGSFGAFTFSNGASISGTLNGNNTTQANQVNVSAYTSAVTVNLTGAACTIANSISDIFNVVGTTSGSNLTTLVGPNTKTWTISGGNNTGTINTAPTTTTFSAFQNLTGTGGGNTFIMGNDGSAITGALNGGTGTNTLSYSAYTTAGAGAASVNLTTDTATHVGSFSNITNFVGSTSNALQCMLTGPSAMQNTWTVTATDTGNINSSAYTFSNFQILVGGSMNDIFNLNAGFRVSNSISGGSGGKGTIQGPTGSAATFNVSSANGGSVTSLVTSFTNIANLQGNHAGDAFEFTAAAGTLNGGITETSSGSLVYPSSYGANASVNIATGVASGLISGATFQASTIKTYTGNATNATTYTLTGPSTASPTWTISSTYGGTITGGYSFTNFGKAVGDMGDTFDFTDDFAMVSVTGGSSGTNTIKGPSVAHLVTWNLSGANGGGSSPAAIISDVNPLLTTFSNIQVLTGQSTSGDDFVFGAGATFLQTGSSIAGGGSAANNTLDFSAYTTAFNVDVNAMTSSVCSSFSNIGNFKGTTSGSNLSTFKGPTTTPQTWDLLSAAPTSSGTVTGGFAFSQFQNLTVQGVAIEATFVFSNGAGVSGTVVGSFGGARTGTSFDYTAYTSGISVNLGTSPQTATGTGSISGVTHFIGATTFPAVAASNTITGPTGASVNTWAMAGTPNSGTINDDYAFDAIGNLVGFSGDVGDTFDFGGGLGGAASVTGSVTGGGGTNANTILGPTPTVASAATWNITGTNAGNLMDNTPQTLIPAFSGIQNLTGQTDSDSFFFSAGATLGGSISAATSGLIDFSAYTTAVTIDLNGNTATPLLGGTFNTNFLTFNGSTHGTNLSTLVGTNDPGYWTVTSAGGGTFEDLTTTATSTFTQFQNLTGGSAANTFDFTGVGASVTGTVNGSTGTATILGPTAGTSGWNITGSGSGSVTGIVGAFSNIKNLTGGSGGDDTFTFSAGGSVAGTVDGNSNTVPNNGNAVSFAPFGSAVTVNLLNNPPASGAAAFNNIQVWTGANVGGNTFHGVNTTTQWNITGSNGGNINGGGSAANPSFTQFQNLTGGSGNNTFSFAPGGSVGGTVSAAAGGTNTLDYNSLSYGSAASVNIATGAATATGGFNTATITNFTGQASLSASNTVTGPNATNTWVVSSADTGNINSSAYVFVNFGNLVGGSGTDTFNFSGGVPVSGSINGGAGTNTFLAPNGAQNISANITGSNSGTIAIGVTTPFNFSNIQNLTGSSGSVNTFFFFTGGSVAGTINGNSSNTGNTADFSNVVGTVTANLNSNPAVPGVAGNFTNIFTYNGNGSTSTIIGPNSGGTTTWTMTGSGAGNFAGAIFFTNFQNLTGGTGNNAFNFSAGSASGTVTGGSGTNTITGPNAAATWDVTGANAGGPVTKAGPTTIIGSFTGIQNLTGGNAGNDFVFSNGATLSGSLVGGSASGNTVDVSGYTSAVNVSLSANTVKQGATTICSYSQIQSFNGSSLGSGKLSTITGTTGTNTWTITANNAGNFNGSPTFTNFQNLVGGGSDTFVFNNGFTLSGTIAGNAGGANVLNMTAYTTETDVNIATGLATPVNGGASGGISNIQTFKGGTLAASNKLTGPTITGGVTYWTISAVNGGSIVTTSPAASFSFTSFGKLIGDQNDTFDFSSDMNVTGSVTGGTGTNNTIIGPASDNTTWDITGTNSGNVYTVNYPMPTYLIPSFSNIQNLTGGNSATNTFVFSTGGSVGGNINGGSSGSNTLNYSSYVGAVTLNLGGTGSTGIGGTITNIQTLTGNGNNGSDIVGYNTANTWSITGGNSGSVVTNSLTFTFTGFPTLTGGSVSDMFNFGSSGEIFSIVGGSGAETINGPNAMQNWHITQAGGTGFATSLITNSFTNIGTIVGGTAGNTFTFSNGATIGTVNGGSSSGNTLSVSAYTSANINPSGTPGSGTITSGATTVVNYINIQTLIGPSSGSTIYGPNSPSTLIWMITAPGAGSINTTPVTNFSNATTLVGGPNTNIFEFSGTGSVDTITGNGLANTIEGPTGTVTWNITGANAGGPSPDAIIVGVTPIVDTFTQINNLTGSTGADTFVFYSGGSISGTVDGGGGGSNAVDYSNLATQTNVNLQSSPQGPGAATFNNIQTWTGSTNSANIFTGPSAASVWNITASNAGNVGTTSFSNFPNVTGGSGGNTFNFASGGSLVGSLVGGSGANSIVYGAGYGAETVSIAAGTATGIGGTFSQIQTFAGSSPASSNTITGPTTGGTTYWTVSSSNGGSIVTSPATVTYSFSGFGNLTGDVNDTFDFTNNQPVSGTVTGGSGTNTILGPSVGTTWNITGSNTGNVVSTVNPLIPSFVNIQNLTGGSGGNTFNWTAGSSSLSGNIVGGSTSGNSIVYGAGYSNVETVTLSTNNGGTATGLGGTFSQIQTLTGNATESNTLVGNNATLWTMSGTANAGTLNTTPTTTTFSNFQNLTGAAAGGNTFNFVTNTGSLSGTLSGGGGSNNLIKGPNTAQTWDITGANTGSAGFLGAFNGVQSLTGGSGTNDFVFSNGATLSGTLNGGSGGANEIDVSAYSSAVTVSLTANTVTTGATTISSFASGTVEMFAGSTGSTIIGGGAASTWNITGANAGNVNTTPATSFTGMSNVTGGSGGNTFNFTAAASSLSGNLVGGSGNNSLVYQAGFSAAETVNIAAGTATAIGGVFSQIQSFTGIAAQAANNTIKGPAITGGSTNWSITSANGGTIATTSPAATYTFAGFGNLTGDQNDIFNFSGDFIVSGTVTGGSGGNNKILGPSSVATTWSITGANTGSVASTAHNPLIPSFVNIQNLTGGGTPPNTFEFMNNNASISGTVDGGGGGSTGNPNIVTFNFGGYTNAVTINLQTLTGTGAGSYAEIQDFIGNDAAGSRVTATNGTNTWVMTGANAGTFNSVELFSNFPNITGGSVNDTFNFSSAGSLSGTLSSAGGTDTILGRSTGSTWNITGANAGNVTGEINLFSFPSTAGNITNLTGGSGGNDDFIFANSAAVTGVINGNSSGLNEANFSAYNTPVNISLVTNTGPGAAGYINIQEFVGGSVSNTITGASNGANDWVVTGANAGTLNGTIQWMAFQQLVGGSGVANTFDFSMAGGTESTVNGDSGTTNTVIGPTAGGTFNISGTNGGDIQGGILGSFTNIQNLTGGTGGNNTFIFANSAKVTGTINGGSVTNTNTANWAAYTSATTVNLTTNVATGIAGAFSNLNNFVGSSTALGTFTGANASSTWTMTATNAGSVAFSGLTDTFSSFSNLIGGTGGNDFGFDGFGITGNLTGGGTSGNILDYTGATGNVFVNLQTSTASFLGGTFSNIQSLIGGSGFANTLTGPNGAVNWAVTSVDSGTVAGIAFSSFQDLVGGTGNDTFTFSSNSSVASVDGGAGCNTIIGPPTSSIPWTVTASNAGHFGTFIVGASFTNIENLTALASSNTFTFHNGAMLTGTVNGGSGDTGNTATFASWTSPLSVQLLTGSPAACTQGFLNIQSFTGSTMNSNMSTLIGASTANTWNITGTNAGNVNGSPTFTAFQNLMGGSSSNTFVFSNGQGVTGTVNGGSSGSNTANWSAYTTQVDVNLTAGTATGTGGIANVQTFIGGSAATNTFTGPNSANTWVITAANAGTINGVYTLSNFQNWTGGPVSNLFDFSSGFNISGVLTGGGTSTLMGPNTANTWTITANNAGNTTSGITFANIGSLIGGSGGNYFYFDNATNLSGSLNGGSNIPNNVIDYTRWLNPQIVVIVFNPNQTSGTASNIAGGFTNIGHIYRTTPPTPPTPPPTPVIPVVRITNIQRLIFVGQMNAANMTKFTNLYQWDAPSYGFDYSSIYRWLPEVLDVDLYLKMLGPYFDDTPPEDLDKKINTGTE